MYIKKNKRIKNAAGGSIKFKDFDFKKFFIDKVIEYKV